MLPALLGLAQPSGGSDMVFCSGLLSGDCQKQSSCKNANILKVLAIHLRGKQAYAPILLILLVTFKKKKKRKQPKNDMHLYLCKAQKPKLHTHKVLHERPIILDLFRQTPTSCFCNSLAVRKATDKLIYIKV